VTYWGNRVVGWSRGYEQDTRFEVEEGTRVDYEEVLSERRGSLYCIVHSFLAERLERLEVWSWLVVNSSPELGSGSCLASSRP